MAFVLRLLFSLGLIIIVVVVTLVFLYVITVLINRGIRWAEENIGGEVGDFFKYLRSKMPRIKIERKVDEEKPESRKTV